MSEINTLDASLVDDQIQYVPAENGKRFANYLIDYIALIVLAGGLGALSVFFDDGALIESELGLNISVYILMFIYYLVCEGFMGGKTLGKLITKTRVMREDGGPLSLGDIALRTICRYVPFEAFSFFGERPGGWHDRWSKTMVIDETKIR